MAASWREKMIRKIILICISLFLIFALANTVACISQYEAKSIAEKYAQKDEIITVSGPYTYMNRPYYYIEMHTYESRIEGYKSGLIILNGDTGAIVKDKNIMQKVFYTHYKIKMDIEVNAETTKLNYGTYLENENIFNKNSNGLNDWKILYVLSSKNYSSLEEMSKLSSDMGKLSGKIGRDHEELIRIESDILRGNQSYENVNAAYAQQKIIRNSQKELFQLEEKYYDHLLNNPDLYKKILDITISESAANKMKAIEKSENLKVREQWEQDLNDQVNREADFAYSKSEIYENFTLNTIRKSTPGFGIILAIASILTIGLLRRKQN